MRFASVGLILLVGLGGCTPPPPEERESLEAIQGASTREVTEAEEVVQSQVEAYNRRHLEAFIGHYSETVEIYLHPDSLWTSGHAGMAELYGPIFEGSPELTATITDRIVHNSYVIDHESVTGFLDNPPLAAVAIYEVVDGKIARVWLML